MNNSQLIQRFLREQFFSNIWLTLWLVILSGGTLYTLALQLAASPLVTTLILLVWLGTVGWTVRDELAHHHNPVTMWLKNNLYLTSSNVIITLLLVLWVTAGLRAFANYALVNATFSTDPITSDKQNSVSSLAELQAQGVDVAGVAAGETKTIIEQTNFWGTPLVETSYTPRLDDPETVDVLRQEVHTGASWGAVIDNLGNLFLFRYKDVQHVWRVWLALGVMGVLLLPSLWIYSQEQFRNSWARTILTWGWLVSPFLLLIILQGVKESEWRPINWVSSLFPYLKPDDIWGGFLLTVIISVFAIVASFPAGVLLALGRRSQVYGIPYQVTYGLTALFTLYFLATSTPANLTAARSQVETVFAFWPLLLPLLAYLFQRNFQGNAIAAFSTIFIEVIRGVPLITVLFMSIILFPIFLPPTYGDAVRSFLPDFIANGLLSFAPDWSGRAVEILGSWRVMVAFAIFSAAYLAENVRGGLQALSKGQYEAADALGLSTFQKYYYIILPQALRLVIPAMVGQFIALFKDTSLVYLVGLFDFLAVANSIASQPKWLGIRTEPYILLLFVYFVGSSLMASYSLYLERRLGVGER